jgi:hypothetical protein
VSLLENLMDQAFAKLSPDERMSLLESTVEKAIVTLTPDERRALLDHVVDRFMEGLTTEQQAALVREVLPALLGRLLQAGNMSVDDFLWAAMGSLHALEGKSRPEGAGSAAPAGDTP